MILIYISVDTDAETTVHPLFSCSLSVNIPVMSMLPTPDEVQSAVVQAVELVVGSLKAVTQWSLMCSDASDTNQPPITSAPATGTTTLHEHRPTWVHINNPNLFEDINGPGSILREFSSESIREKFGKKRLHFSQNQNL